MTQIKHAYVAAKHAQLILRWVQTKECVSKDYLRHAFDLIYNPSSHGHLYSKAKDRERYETLREVSFSGVFLIYHHFYGHQEPHLDEMKSYVSDLGPSQMWGDLVRDFVV